MQRADNQGSFAALPIATLYQRYAYTLLMSIRRHVRSQEDAEDLLVEVFLAALESKTLPQLREGEQLAWLRRVAHNKCVDYQRRAVHRAHLPLDEMAGQLYDDERSAPAHLAEQHEDDELVREQVALLSEQQQELLRLRFAQGLRAKQIAERMNKSEGAVRVLLTRALNTLRKNLLQVR